MPYGNVPVLLICLYFGYCKLDIITPKQNKVWKDWITVAAHGACVGKSVVYLMWWWYVTCYFFFHFISLFLMAHLKRKSTFLSLHLSTFFKIIDYFIILVTFSCFTCHHPDYFTAPTTVTNKPCPIPFTYNGVSYDNCITLGNNGQPWCPLQAVHVIGGPWENCASCPSSSCGRYLAKSRNREIYIENYPIFYFAMCLGRIVAEAPDNCIIVRAFPHEVYRDGLLFGMFFLW